MAAINRVEFSDAPYVYAGKTSGSGDVVLRRKARISWTEKETERRSSDYCV